MVMAAIAPTALGQSRALQCIPEDLLTLNLTELTVDVRDGGDDTRDDDVVQRVHTTVRKLDRLVQGSE